MALPPPRRQSIDDLTPPSARVAHIVGRTLVGDPVTATARAMRERLAWEGWPGPLLSAATMTADDRSEGPPALGAGLPVVVHSVEGGAALRPLLGQLVGRPLILVHHGSARGSDRAVLRSLRASTERALAATAAGREELRALGFAEVEPIGGDPLATTFHHAFDQVAADDTTTGRLRGHPGPLILAVGPVDPGQGMEALLEAMSHVVTHDHPAAVLSLCGPMSGWYGEWLHRRIVSRGLECCELISPSSEGEVLARLDHAAVVVAGRAGGLDPYRWRAAHRGARLVTSPKATVADPTALADAMGAALDEGARSRSALEDEGAGDRPDRPITEPVLARALGLT